MNTSTCQNCLSSKRQFYVYLWCSHVVCLNCCICLTNFQTMTIRCCYRNTELSQQLQTIIMQQAIRNKGNMIAQTDNSNQTQNINNYGSNPSNTTDFIKQNQNNYQVDPYHRLYDRVNPHILQDKIEKVQSFYLSQKERQAIEQNKLIKNNHKSKQSLQSNQSGLQLQPPSFGGRHSDDNFDKNAKSKKVQQLTQFQHQYPFLEKQKQTNLKFYQQRKNQENVNHRYIVKEITNLELPKNRYLPKSNNVCWKNHQTVTDRISAKLNYHQQKMNSLLEKHYVK